MKKILIKISIFILFILIYCGKDNITDNQNSQLAGGVSLICFYLFRSALKTN